MAMPKLHSGVYSFENGNASVRYIASHVPEGVESLAATQIILGSRSRQMPLFGVGACKIWP